MRPVLFLAVLLLPLIAVPLLAQVAGGQRPQPAVSSTAPAEPVAVGGTWHVVREGENLRNIAQTYYGSGRYWRTVQLANDVGLTPDPGRRIWVPGHLPELP